jgi:hypothetical protein
MKTKISAFVGAAMMVGSGALNAAVLFSDFGAGDTFNTNVLYGPVASMATGFRFTASSTGDVTSLDAAIQAGTYSGSGGPPPVTVTLRLYADSGNTLGTLLESSNITSTGIWNGTQTVVTALFSGTNLLTTGQDYWLVGIAGTNWTWNYNDTGATGLETYNGGFPTNSFTLPAFRVNGTLSSGTGGTVPEPASLVIVGLGLLGAFLARRKVAPKQ